LAKSGYKTNREIENTGILLHVGTTRTYYRSMMVSKEESFLGDFITLFLKI
jgi:hypothetical protein